MIINNVNSRCFVSTICSDNKAEETLNFYTTLNLHVYYNYVKVFIGVLFSIRKKCSIDTLLLLYYIVVF